ncbi:LysR family transcriptional regulator [Falsiroseomonas sp. E2-1-a20]|uniref:LysR family transcriptional regulator n=1 Tax=Falsiroseomonas sp. E2-1-a20 TaxID=3239300 RepID=UPI003F39A505
MNSDDLRVFLRLAEARSLTGAARLLRRPKSSVSRQLARLEAEAGAALLDRARDGLRLTDAGRVLLDHAVQVVALVDGAAAAVQASFTAPRGLLRVNVPSLFASHILAPRLPEFLRDHPALEVALEVSSHVAGANKPEIDILVRVGALEDSALLARRIGASSLRLLASPSALAGLAPEAAHRLLEEAGALQPGRGRFNRVIGFAGGRASQRVEASDPLVRHALALSGAGAAWLPEFLCRADLAEGRLVEVAPHQAPSPLPLHALYTVQAATSPKVRHFVDFLARITTAALAR